MVGARGFEPPTSASRTLRANQTALRPDGLIIGGFNNLSNNDKGDIVVMLIEYIFPALGKGLLK